MSDGIEFMPGDYLGIAKAICTTMFPGDRDEHGRPTSALDCRLAWNGDKWLRLRPVDSTADMWFWMSPHEVERIIYELPHTWTMRKYASLPGEPLPRKRAFVSEIMAALKVVAYKRNTDLACGLGFELAGPGRKPLS